MQFKICHLILGVGYRGSESAIYYDFDEDKCDYKDVEHMRFKKNNYNQVDIILDKNGNNIFNIHYLTKLQKCL